MPPRPVRFTAARHATRPHLVEPAHVDPDGRTGPTPGEARGRLWRRSGPGHYVPALVDGDDPEQRVLEAGRSLRGAGAVTGWSALSWVGASWFEGRGVDGPRRVPLALGGQRLQQRPGILVCREGMRPDEIHECDGLPVTSPARSALFEMRYAASVREAVVVLDMAAAADVLTIGEAAAYAERLQTWTGIPQAREAINLAAENSWSPQETRLRLVWVLDAGLPAPRCNLPVFDRGGRHVATPDLLDAASGLAVEYDGDVHLSRERRARDVVREHAMRELGLEVTVVVGRDMRSRARVAERLRAARARARWEPEGERRWTITPPPWWAARDTVAGRRALVGQDGQDSPLDICRGLADFATGTERTIRGGRVTGCPDG